MEQNDENGEDEEICDPSKDPRNMRRISDF